MTRRLAAVAAAVLTACATPPAGTSRSTRQPSQATRDAVVVRDDPRARRLLLVISRQALEAHMEAQRRLANGVEEPVLKEWAFAAAVSQALNVVQEQNPGVRLEWTPMQHLRLLQVDGADPLVVVPAGPIETVAPLDDAPAPVPR